MRINAKYPTYLFVFVIIIVFLILYFKKEKSLNCSVITSKKTSILVCENTPVKITTDGTLIKSKFGASKNFVYYPKDMVFYLEKNNVIYFSYQENSYKKSISIVSEDVEYIDNNLDGPMILKFL